MELSSNPNNIAQVEHYLTDIVKQWKINDELYGNILVALTEAVNNAIIHGNKAKESKLVKIECIKKGTLITFLIEDEGVGFDPETVADPTLDENILKPGGRGVFLMKELSDDISFHQDGKCVELKFNIA